MGPRKPLDWNYSKEDLKSLIVDDLNDQIKPNVCRYWDDHHLSDLESLVIYVRSRMTLTPPSGVNTRLLMEKKTRDRRSVTISQVHEVD